jgi:thiamine-monophosphate kinase
MPLPEKTLIAQIRRQASKAKRSTTRVPTGIGDDCAILRVPPNHDSLITTDFSLEGIHFRRDWHPPESVGHRCLARGLSDIAAMAGEPVAAFLSLALPRDVPQSWVQHFLRGLLALAKKYNVTLAGGDTAQSPTGIQADIIVLGSVPKGQAILRSTARPGDAIYVTGSLGASAAALAQLQSQEKTLRHPEGSSAERTYPRHFYPDPRLTVARTLRQRRLATSMIDLSDGLSTDLTHICQESQVGAKLEAARIPRAQLLPAKDGKPTRQVDLNQSLHGGEDYELLFTAPPHKRVPTQLAGVPITKIGEITHQRRIVIVDAKNAEHKLRPQGWEYFRK